MLIGFTKKPKGEVINVKTLSTPISKEAKHAHDEIAALLSIVPGARPHLQRPL